MLPIILSLLPVPQSPSPKDALTAILNRPSMQGAIISAIVTDLQGRVIFEQNSSTRVMPASNQKLLAAAFALCQVGPEARPQTRFWKLDDRLIIDSPGDPLMRSALLIDASEKLKLPPNFPVYVREAYSPGIPDSWEQDDLIFTYASPVSAFTVDRGTTELWNENGRYRFRPRSYDLRTQRMRPGTTNLAYDPAGRRVWVAGDLPLKRERLAAFPLPKPNVAAASYFGKYADVAEELPATKPTLIISGRPMKDVLAECLPSSDNNIAENLLLMGADHSGPLGANPYAAARKRMTAFLEDEVGVPKGDLRVYDGSGLSRHNLVTTRAVAKLLAWMELPTFQDVWRKSLVTPRLGTLSSRLDGVGFAGKTGSLDMVAALSGYLRTDSGNEVIVSVIANHYLCPNAEARTVLDDFVRASQKLRP